MSSMMVITMKEKIKNYEQQLVNIADVFKVSDKTMDTLQKQFVVAFGLVFVGILITMIVQINQAWFGDGVLQMFLGLLLSIGASGISLMGLSIFLVAVLENGLKKSSRTPLFESMTSPTGKSFYFLMGVYVGYGLLTMLPYISASILVNMGLTSNLFVAYEYTLFILGALMFAYMYTKTIGMLVLRANGQETGLSETFKRFTGHGLSVLMILLVVTVPALAAGQLLISCIEGIRMISDNMAIETVIVLSTVFIKTAVTLIWAYLFFSALINYMKQEKLLS